MANKYCVVRTDKMTGTDQRVDLVSLRMYDGEGANANKIAVENGVIAKLVALEDGQREVWKARVATNADALADCVLVAGVETLYDERKRNLDEYINEAGKATRGYVLRSNGEFSETAEGFVNGTVPTKGQTVGIGANGKLAAGGTGLGKCVAIETAGRYTYYVIKLGVTEA